VLDEYVLCELIFDEREGYQGVIRVSVSIADAIRVSQVYIYI